MREITVQIGCIFGQEEVWEYENAFLLREKTVNLSHSKTGDHKMGKGKIKDTLNRTLEERENEFYFV